jgi:hypothetical protein
LGQRGTQTLASGIETIESVPKRRKRGTTIRSVPLWGWQPTKTSLAADPLDGQLTIELSTNSGQFPLGSNTAK